MPATESDVSTAIEALVFRDRLAALGLTLREFSARTGSNYRTVLGWGTIRATGSGRAFQAYPTWVLLLLAEWEAHGLPPG